MRIFNIIKNIAPAAAILTSTLIFYACSREAGVIAVYEGGNEEKSLAIGEVKSTMLRFVMSFGNDFITNRELQKDIIFRTFLVPEIAIQDQISKGFTNTLNFKDAFETEYKKNELGILESKGYDMLTNQAENDQRETYEVVHPAHIMLSIRRTTNINILHISFIITNGLKIPVTNYDTIQTNLSDKAYGELVKSKQDYAYDIIKKVKTSDNPLKEFEDLALNKSEDPISSSDLGDIGLIPRGCLARQYEDAIFSADKQGILDKPVFTDYSIYVIYIKAPVVKMTRKMIEKQSGKENFFRIKPALDEIYYQRSLSNNIREYYSIDNMKKAIMIGGKEYKISDLPDSAVMFDLFGRQVTWKNCVDDHLLFQADSDKNMNFETFMNNINAVKKVIFFSEFARKKGIENDPKFLKYILERKHEITKNIIFENFRMELTSNLNIKLGAYLTLKAINDYYETNKEAFTKTVNNKTVQLTFSEALPEVKETMRNQYLTNAGEQWKEDLLKKAKVIYKESGLNDLKELEIEQFNNYLTSLRPK